MQIEVIKNFAYAYGGTDVVHYTAGETFDVPDECGELAIAEGWASAPGVKAVKPAATKARKAAPENK
jgi:hypothetical protein